MLRQLRGKLLLKDKLNNNLSKLRETDKILLLKSSLHRM